MAYQWIPALAAIAIAVPIHIGLGKVAPYVMRAVLCVTRAAISAAIALVVVTLAMEVA